MLKSIAVGEDIKITQSVMEENEDKHPFRAYNNLKSIMKMRKEAINDTPMWNILNTI